MERLASFARPLASRLCAAALLLAPLPALASAPADGAAEPRRITKPKRNSLEYRLSWGLQSIRAARAYGRGIDGSGVTVAMIDTGIGASQAGLFEHVSQSSTDLIAKRKDGGLGADHGRQTASLLAAALDGEGTVGVAFGATLLSIRADIDGSCATQCSVRGEDLARGIDYAVAHGAKIIGVPLVGPRPLPSVEPALQRAIAAGAVIVAAAGNDGAGRPSWPARYAADPRFARGIIVAGASTFDGQLAGWSSKAAEAAPRYVAAPGENVIVDCTTETCALTSGTSYSVSYVAGALSLVMAAQPSLTAQEGAEILLAAASDRGKKGIDPVTGRGMLDVARALRLASETVKTASRGG